MQTRPFFPETRKAKILSSTTFVVKWVVILGAAWAFAVLLIVAVFNNNLPYFASMSNICVPRR